MDIIFHTNLKYSDCEKIAFVNVSVRRVTSFIFKYYLGSFSVKKIDLLYSNSFSRIFYGEVERTSEGTRIRGKFRLSPITKTIIGIAYGVIFSVDLLIICKILFFNSSDPSFPIGELFEALLLLLIGKLLILSIIKKGLYESLKNEDHIINYIKILFKIDSDIRSDNSGSYEIQ